MVEAAISGVLAGAAVAMLGLCVVFMYRMVRVLNFAQVAVGTAGAFAAIVLGEHGWAFVPAAFAGMVAAVVLGCLCGLIMSVLFRDSSTEARSTVAITFLIALVTLGTWIFGSEPRPIPEPLPNQSVKIGGLHVAPATIITLVLAIVLALAVTWMLRSTRLGVRLRAMSERPQTAELLGVPSRRFAVGVWAVAAAISALAVLLTAPTHQSDFSSLSIQLLLPAVAAASVGLLRSFTGAIVGGLAIGVLQALITYDKALSTYAEALPLLAILMVLVWTQRKAVWDEVR